MGDYGLAQGAERMTGRMLGMGMNLMELQAHQQNRQQALAMEQERLDMTKAEHNLQMGEAQKKIAMQEKPIDIKVHPLYLSLPPDSQKAALEFFVSNKMTDENGIGKTGDVMRGVEMIEKSKPLFETMMMPVVKTKQAAVNAAWGEVQAAKEKGDPKKIAEAEATFQQRYLEYGDALGKYDAHMKTIIGMEKQEKEQFSEPYNLGGAIVQKGSSGKIHQVVGRPPVGEGEGAKVTKMDNKARQIEKDAADEAKRQTMLKFNLQPAVTIDSEGRANVTWPANRPEVFEYYTSTKDQITKSKTKAAVKRGVLSKDYLPEEATYRSADEVKAAFGAGKITEAEAIKILQRDFNMK